MPSATQAWVERLRAVIPSGSSTGSKIPKYLPEEPGVIVRGKGCRVWDADGREFIDYRNSLGPVTLGYCFPAVDRAIRAQLKNGIIYGHAHPLEGEVAELLTGCIPCAQRVRFLKTGGEAAAAAIRLARYHTGREHVIQIGYNGWLNSLAAGARMLPGMTAKEVPPGVPRCLSALHHAGVWNDHAGLEELFKQYEGQVAALVIAADYSGMADGKTFYPFVRELTKRHGTVLIYDEIVTGFRMAIGGIQEYFKVTPDLAIFAKGIANGMPLSAYCGAAEIMDKLDRCIVSSTYGGETLSLAAAKAAIQVYQTRNVTGHIWKQAGRLCQGLSELFNKAGLPLRIEGLPPCFYFGCAPDAPPDVRDRFFRMAYRNGVSFYDFGYVNFSVKDKDVDETLERLARGVKEL